MIRKTIAPFILCLLMSSFAIASGNWSQTANKGDEAYAQGNYSAAINHYSDAVVQMNQGTNPQDALHSSTLLYNLGNAYYKSEQLGQAILYWEKAKLLAPHHKEINANLKIATDEIKGEVIPVKPFFLVKWWNNIQSSFPSSTWSTIAICLLWWGILGILVWLLGKKRKHKKIGFLSGVTCLALCILPFFWAFGKNKIEKDTKRAIIMVSQTHLRPAPDGAGEFEIFEGTELYILDQIGDWTKVRLLNSDVGWVKLEEYEKI